MSQGFHVRRVAGSRELGRFLEVPHIVQGHDPHWIAPLFFMERMRFDEKKNPWFQHGEAAYWIAAFLCGFGERLGSDIVARLGGATPQRAVA